MPKQKDRIELTALIESVAASPRNAVWVSWALDQALEDVFEISEVVFVRAHFHTG